MENEKPKTLEVRIPVVVCECGRYVARTHYDDLDSYDDYQVLPCTCSANGQRVRYHITATVARPTPQRAPDDIAGEVSQ